MINEPYTEKNNNNVNLKLYFLKHEYMYMTNGSIVNSYTSYNQPVTILSDITDLKEFSSLFYILFSFEGPVLAPEGQSHTPTSPSPQLEELEPRFLEFEQDPPNWRELASPEEMSSLSKKETKRQEVINGTKDRWIQPTVRRLHCFKSIPVPRPLSELYATEHAHVRMLSVLQGIFSKPLEREELLTTIELSTIFPSLDEIIEMHCKSPESAMSAVFAAISTTRDRTLSAVSRMLLSALAKQMYHL